MEAILVRIGMDHAYGGGNAPVDPETCEFVYVPIPENPNVRFHRRCKRSFRDVLPALEQFADKYNQDLYTDIKFPGDLHDRALHLDPDFENLTYGDNGDRRGAGIAKLTRGDLLVFYAGLRSIRPRDRELVYAIVGLFVVEEVVNV